MAAFGLLPEDIAPEDVEIWPENEPAVNLVRRIGTQWNVGPTGPTGLIYASVYPLMDRLGLDVDAWNSLLDDIRVMENAALEVMRETK